MKTVYLTFLWLLIAALLVMLQRDDWLQRRAGRRRVRAKVVGYRSDRDPKGIETFAPVLRIEEGSDAGHEGVDPVFKRSRTPAMGTLVFVVYPAGRPDRAHLPHPWIGSVSYVSLIGMLVVVTFALLGRLPHY